MKKEQFIRRAIALYTEALDWAKRSKCNTNALKRYLEKRRLQGGLCRLASAYGLEERSRLWIYNHLAPYSQWICTPPFQLRTKREICESMETRLAVLRKELKKCR